MKKRNRILILVIIIIFEIGFIYWSGIFNVYFDLAKKSFEIRDSISDISIDKINKKIFSPEPIRVSEKEVEQVSITRKGIIEWTNFHREKYKLDPLIESEDLNNIADIKIRNMFEDQYFAHVSPDNVDIGGLAEEGNYDFIIIGENLALGGFSDDKDLVQGWMDSPGHRENILNSRYKEIGVAAGEGIFEGNNAWIGVQVFATPLSICFQPDIELKIKIEDYQKEKDKLEKQINSLFFEIESMYPKRGKEYQRKVEQYNNLINDYNILLEEIRLLIDEYNEQVFLFNECLNDIKL
jgi:hypothetical protein